MTPQTEEFMDMDGLSEEAPFALSNLERDPAEVAAELGLKIINSTDTLLQIDLDTDADILRHAVLFAKFYTEFDYFESSITTRSKSGEGVHVYIKLRAPMSAERRIAFQAALGSDPMRELLSLSRIFNSKRDVASVLFETDAEYQNVMLWLEPTEDLPF
jgi:hypothetical protein